MQGQIYRDSTAGKTVLVDGIIASLFYAFDRYADKTVINSTLARNFGFDELKNARNLLYQAFSLQDVNGKIQDKRTEETLLKDVWEKVTKIDMSGHVNVVVCMPYNFIIPQFLSDADYLSETSKNTTNTLMMERMVNLEKKVEEKNSKMMSMLQSINSKIGNNPVGSQPTFTQSYAGIAAGRHQGRQHQLTVPGGAERERSPSLKRPSSEEATQPSKRRNTEKSKVVAGTRTNARKMKSPPADIFVYGVPRDTSKEDIMEDLLDSNIEISIDDIILMSKGNPAVVSYRISVKAEDLQSALDPSVWPLRVKVREFIHYRKRQDMRQPSSVRQEMCQPEKVRQEMRQKPDVRVLIASSGVDRGNSVGTDVNMFNMLENDVQA